jgi:hypothetical protein
MANEVKTVWVIERGEYSDYSVAGVFSTEANARKIAALVHGDVAEWPLDPGIAELNQGLHVFNVRMTKDGVVEKCERLEYVQHIDPVTVWRRSTDQYFRGQNKPDVMLATVWAKDETHATKITNEHRAEWIASGKWDG